MNLLQFLFSILLIQKCWSIPVTNQREIAERLIDYLEDAEYVQRERQEEDTENSEEEERVTRPFYAVNVNKILKGVLTGSLSNILNGAFAFIGDPGVRKGVSGIVGTSIGRPNLGSETKRTKPTTTKPTTVRAIAENSTVPGIIQEANFTLQANSTLHANSTVESNVTEKAKVEDPFNPLTYTLPIFPPKIKTSTSTSTKKPVENEIDEEEDNDEDYEDRNYIY